VKQRAYDRSARPVLNAAMNVRENIAGDVLASLTTMLWNTPSKAWTGGAPMADS
jgi:hypothetical protein